MPHRPKRPFGPRDPGQVVTRQDTLTTERLARLTIDRPGERMDTSFDDETPAVGSGSLFACLTSFSSSHPPQPDLTGQLAPEEPPELPKPDIPDSVSDPVDPFEIVPAGLVPQPTTAVSAPQRYGLYLGAFLVVVGAGVVCLTLGLKVLAW